MWGGALRSGRANHRDHHFGARSDSAITTAITADNGGQAVVPTHSGKQVAPHSGGDVTGALNPNTSPPSHPHHFIPTCCGCEVDIRGSFRERGAGVGGAADQLRHHLDHHRGCGHPGGPAALREHLARLLGGADAAGPEPGAGARRLRDHGRRHEHLQRQDGHADGEPHDRGPGLLCRPVRSWASWLSLRAWARKGVRWR